MLGNHDLHLLALAFVPAAGPRRGDTLDDVLAARDRDALLAWLLGRPLAVHDAAHGDLLVHAGLVPQWSVRRHARAGARGAGRAARRSEELLRRHVRQPPGYVVGRARAAWSALRFTINVLTRSRLCTAGGRINLKEERSAVGRARALDAVVRHRRRATARYARDVRPLVGAGFLRRDNVLALDTGCVWGGALTAVNLDAAGAQPISVPSRQPRQFGEV